MDDLNAINKMTIGEVFDTNNYKFDKLLGKANFQRHSFIHFNRLVDTFNNHKENFYEKGNFKTSENTVNKKN